MFDRSYCIKFGKKYGTIFCHGLAVNEPVHIILIPVFLVKEHREVQDGCHHGFDLDVSKLTRHGGCCTLVVVQNEIQIQQQKRRKAYLFAIISMQNEPNPFLCHPAVLESRKFATCFLSHLFYSQFGIVKI